ERGLIAILGLELAVERPVWHRDAVPSRMSNVGGADGPTVLLDDEVTFHVCALGSRPPVPHDFRIDGRCAWRRRVDISDERHVIETRWTERQRSHHPLRFNRPVFL